MNDDRRGYRRSGRDDRIGGRDNRGDEGGGQAGEGYRGRGRGRGRNRGRGRGRVNLSKNAEYMLEGVGREDVLTNLMEIEINENQTFWVYPINFPEEVKSRNQKMFIYHRTREQLLKDHIKDPKGVVVTTNNVVSIERLDFMKDLELHVVDGWDIKFEEKNVQLNKSNYQEVETILNEVLHQVIERDESFKKEWRIRESAGERRYQFHRFEHTTHELNSDMIEDWYLEKQIYKCYSVKVVNRDKGWFMQVRPSFRIQKKYPNGLKLIEKFRDFGMRSGEINNRFRDMSIESYAHRRGERRDITSIRFDMKAGDTVNFGGEKYEGLSFKEYFFGGYRRQLEKRGIYEEDVRNDQPMIEIVNESRNKTEHYIPQMVSINCRIRDEKAFLQQFITEHTNEGLRASLNRIGEWMEFMSTTDLSKSLEFFGIKIDPRGKFEPCRMNQVSDVSLAPFGGGRNFHTMRDGYEWQRKTNMYELQDKIEGKGINFDGILFLFDRNSERDARRILDIIVESCERKRIPCNTDLILMAPLIRDRDDSFKRAIEKYVNDFGKKPKILICVPNRDEDVYGRVIAHCMQEGIMEQFIRGEKLIPRRLKVVGYNVFLQIYCKLGGCLWHVDGLSPYFFGMESSSLLVGVDCSYQDRSYVSSELGERKKLNRYPSMMCMVASCPTKAWTRRVVYLLEEDDEDVSGIAMKNGMDYFLRKFKEEFKKDPHNILVYREGVPLNKIERVKREEVESILRIKPKDSKLVFTVVQKRGRMMFFDGEGNNPPAGTVINKGITYNKRVLDDYGIYRDFYMVANENRRIAVKPVHYINIVNDHETYDDEFEQMTFELCCLYFNFPGTIKVPYVVQLADILGRKMYKTVFQLRGSKSKGFSMQLRTPYYSVKERLEKDGESYPDEEGIARIVMSPTYEEGMFEL